MSSRKKRQPFSPKQERTETYKESLFKNAGQVEFARSRRLRKSMTPAEERLWQHLRRKRLGVKFRRQHPLGHYTVDFYCHERGLVVEVDGSHHQDEEQQETDANRTAELERMGLRVIRFRNEEVMEGIGVVLVAIENALGEEQ